MCGLVGFIPSFNEEKDKFLINKMLSRIKYRGPDNTGFYRNNKIALGHHRLSIIDLKGGSQPTFDNASKDCLVFNGEIYGYKKHAKQLSDLGIKLNDLSDTEVLFKLLINFGIEKTLKKIDGMFSFAYFNSVEKSLYLVRDRAGEKPLFYSIHGKYLLFGSEVKTITDFPLFQNSLNFSAIADYLQLDYVSINKTLFKNIYKVQPGEYIKYHKGKLTSHTYWKLNQENKVKISEKEAVINLDEMIENSVKERLISDVPIGLFLSGGIDSSLIAYYSQKYSSKIESFTIKMENKSYDESKYADIVSKHLGIVNHSIFLEEKDLLDSLAVIEKKLDEPLNDPSIIPTYLVSKLARKNVKVVLSGDGADELFSGYSPFKYIFIMKLLSCYPKLVGSTIYKLFNNIPYKDNYMSILFLIKQISKGIGYKTNQQIFRWMSSFTHNDIEKISIKNFREKYLQYEDIIEFLSEKYNDINVNTHDQITQMFFENYLPNDILTKVDRASMYNSLEVRSPFLDKNIIEFASSIRNNLKVKKQTKYILRKVSNKKLPKNIVDRKKHGFAIPLARMLRSSLREKVADTLLSNNNYISNFFEKKYINKILKDHEAGVDLRKQIWSLYILEKTLENSYR
ncbi:MAG: asparagine synthase (glutamine-hydrolyzing) [Pelagibacterales bacterium]|nr:asparagine synthase (glutamine-hydrolyzing) [Pelagibacterales bacterium]